MSGESSGGGWLSAIAPSLITAGTTLLGNYFNQGAEKDQAEDLSEARKEELILQYKLAALKQQYSGGGGGGGGGGGPDRTAQLLNAYQNYIASNRAAKDRQSMAFQELGRAATAPLLK